MTCMCFLIFVSFVFFSRCGLMMLAEWGKSPMTIISMFLSDIMCIFRVILRVWFSST